MTVNGGVMKRFLKPLTAIFVVAFILLNGSGILNANPLALTSGTLRASIESLVPPALGTTLGTQAVDIIAQRVAPGMIKLAAAGQLGKYTAAGLRLDSTSIPSVDELRTFYGFYRTGYSLPSRSGGSYDEVIKDVAGGMTDIMRLAIATNDAKTIALADMTNLRVLALFQSFFVKSSNVGTRRAVVDPEEAFLGLYVGICGMRDVENAALRALGEGENAVLTNRGITAEAIGIFKSAVRFEPRRVETGGFFHPKSTVVNVESTELSAGRYPFRAMGTTLEDVAASISVAYRHMESADREALNRQIAEVVYQFGEWSYAFGFTPERIIPSPTAVVEAKSWLAKLVERVEAVPNPMSRLSLVRVTENGNFMTWE